MHEDDGTGIESFGFQYAAPGTLCHVDALLDGGGGTEDFRAE